MALEVNPASPRVGLVPGFSFDDMSVSFLTFLGCKIEDGNVRRDGDVQAGNLSRKTIDQRLGSRTFVRFCSTLRCIDCAICTVSVARCPQIFLGNFDGKSLN